MYATLALVTQWGDLNDTGSILNISTNATVAHRQQANKKRNKEFRIFENNATMDEAPQEPNN